MDGQDYPIEHFRQMTELAEELKRLPAQILEHEYLYYAFGNWSTVVQFEGFGFWIGFDGKEGEYLVQRSKLRNRPYEWGEVLWRNRQGGPAAVPIAEIISAIKAVHG